MMKRLICVCLLLLIVVTASAQPYAIGHRSVSWQDPERGNRTVTAEGYYPANSAGDNVPVASGSFPVV